jgi:hypothetical protein
MDITIRPPKKKAMALRFDRCVKFNIAHLLRQKVAKYVLKYPTCKKTMTRDMLQAILRNCAQLFVIWIPISEPLFREVAM